MIIGLIGVKNSGKTTAAHILTEFLGPCLITSFADKLKRTCSEVFDIPLNHFEDRKAKEDLHEDKYILASHILKVFDSFGINGNDTKLMQMAGTKYNSNRELLQIVGTDILRSHDEDIHVKTIYPVKGLCTIIGDCRFESEAKYLDNLGAYLIYIEDSESESLVTDASHQSEKEVIAKTYKYANYVVDNTTKDMSELRKQLEQIAFDICFYKNL